jgi:hypothetical protein
VVESSNDGSSHTPNKTGDDDNNAIEIEDFEDDTFDISGLLSFFCPLIILSSLSAALTFSL